MTSSNMPVCVVPKLDAKREVIVTARHKSEGGERNRNAVKHVGAKPYAL